MRSVLVAWAGLVLGVVQAAAADLPLPAPVTPPASYTPLVPPYMNWGGVYLGVNGGYDFGMSNWSATGNFQTNGAVVGGTLGVNLPIGPLILGFEGDIDWANINGSNSIAQCKAAGATTGAVCETKIDPLGTARARLGYAFDRLLLFVTAGGASAYANTGLKPPGTFDNAFQIGWTVGGGAELALVDNWTVKAEYLYINLGTGNCSTVGNCGGAAGAALTMTESIVRAGVNYKFSW